MFTETCYSVCIMARKSPKKDIGDIVGDVAKALGRAAAQNPAVAQNIKYFNAVKAGPTAVAKTAATDLAWAGAGAAVSRIAGAGITRLGGKLGKSVSDYTSDKSFDVLSRGLDKMKGGGRVFSTNTPMGPSLGSTRIMTPGQRDAAISGLKQAASNRADEIGSAISADVRAVAGAAAANIRAAAPAVVVGRKKPRGGGTKKK